MPGDSGDGALGGNEGEMRGPNNLASGDFDGAGAGLGNIVAWRAEGARSRRTSRSSNPAPTPPIPARGATALPGRRIWKLLAAAAGIGGEIGSEAS